MAISFSSVNPGSRSPRSYRLSASWLSPISSDVTAILRTGRLLSLSLLNRFGNSFNGYSPPQKYQIILAFCY
nr:MAG TPA: hypothetical protein [Caudoviricetes sp.]